MPKAIFSRVHVLPDKKDEITKGGIYIPKNVIDRDHQASEVGTIIDIAPGAGKNLRCNPSGELDFKIGDKVYIPRYDCQKRIRLKGGVEIRVLNDEDIIGLVTADDEPEDQY